uniref:Uncharacterized protein n=1 Tax=Brassica campestris TaxID=3711 RepID=M4F1I9_BRACM
MVTSQVHLSELKVGRCRETVQLTFCSGRLFLNATSSTHLFFDSETSGQKVVDCLVGKVEDEAWSLRIQRPSRSLHHNYRNWS